MRIRPIENFLNSLTMYRLLIYGLGTIATLAVVFAYMGVLTLPGNDLLISVVTLVLGCYVFNWILAKLYGAPAATESAAITGFILFFILNPARDTSDILALLFAALVAMTAKYILAFRHRHFFNPAAFGAVVVTLLGLSPASWWVGNSRLFPFVLLLGILITWKIKRARMVLAFAALALIILASTAGGLGMANVLKESILSGPLLFFATIMLTEPFTTPPTRYLQVSYGLLAAVLFAGRFHFGPIFIGPELALILANIVSYSVSSKQRYLLRLRQKISYGPNVVDFVFDSDYPLHFRAGQYIEWTLPHRKVDGRGNRRYFTIASSPTEPEIHLGVKFPKEPSSFKTFLHDLPEGGMLSVGPVMGDFVLPSDSKRKIAFLAGGIGITPFRSMVKSLLDKNSPRDIALIYSVSSSDEIAYQDIFDAAVAIGVKTTYMLSSQSVPASWQGKTGLLTAETLQSEIPDYKERTFYLSGPPVMVDAYKDMLRKLRVSRQRIITDYFPGY